jgi:hypothetical protein
MLRSQEAHTFEDEMHNYSLNYLPTNRLSSHITKNPANNMKNSAADGIISTAKE